MYKLLFILFIIKLYARINMLHDVNAIQDRKEKVTSSPSAFSSPVSSPKVGTSPQNSLTFSFNGIPSTSPNLLNLNQVHSSKTFTFSGQINPYLSE